MVRSADYQGITYGIHDSFLECSKALKNNPTSHHMTEGGNRSADRLIFDQLVCLIAAINTAESDAERSAIWDEMAKLSEGLSSE